MRQQLRRNRQTTRRRVAEAEAASIREHARVQRTRDGRRNLAPQHLRHVIHQLGRRAGRRVAHAVGTSRIVRRHVMVDHQLGHRQRTHGIGEVAQPRHVADVQHDQQVDVAKSPCTLRRHVGEFVAEQEVEHVGPRRRVDDAHLEPARSQDPRERTLRATAVAIRIQVGTQCHLAASDKFVRHRLDRRAAVGGYSKQVEGHGHGGWVDGHPKR